MELNKLLGQTAAARGVRSEPMPLLREGIVTRSDTAGVFVTPAGRDARSPLGPCKGAKRQALVSVPGGGYELRSVPLGLGTRVLFLADGPWIVMADL